MYEADSAGMDRVVLATSDPGVVAAVERAISERIARKAAPDPEIGTGGGPK